MKKETSSLTFLWMTVQKLPTGILKKEKGKLADSQSMTNQKWKLIIGHMGNRDRARDELWFYERRRTSEDTVCTLFCTMENPP